MQVATSPKELLSILNAYRRSEMSVGLVPTMGALHLGHLSLIEASQAENDFTVVSIFVNPLQFNKEEDLRNYPRPFDADLAMLRQQGVELVYAPAVEDMYPEAPKVRIDFGEMATIMEGKFRPGHFDAVGLVVSKLLHQVQPQRAYFGEKDLQQLLLVKRMVEDFSFPTQIIGMPIIRESSGLAMSSRNQRLSVEGKSIATNIFKGLLIAKEEIFKKNPFNETKSIVNDFYSTIEGIDLEYLEIVNARNLTSATEMNPQMELAICVAAYVEGIRLIDNLYLRQD
jgi:pantoate--beta-alanine ligase